GDPADPGPRSQGPRDARAHLSSRHRHAGDRTHAHHAGRGAPGRIRGVSLPGVRALTLRCDVLHSRPRVANLTFPNNGETTCKARAALLMPADSFWAWPLAPRSPLRRAPTCSTTS